MARSIKATDYETSDRRPAGARLALPAWKRALDLACVVVAAPAILAAGAGVALVIKAGSRGSVLFKQRRVGHGGREFLCYKFRTMQDGVETESHRQYTRELINSQKPMRKLDEGNDPRVIPLGKLLRATGLDELPQVLNVIRGEMSLVGPRPCIPYEAEGYEQWHRRRFEAVPGLTGLWQVSGKNRTTFEEMVRLDIRYAEQKSLWLDLLIMMKTLPALWSQVREIQVSRRTRVESAAAGIADSV